MPASELAVFWLTEISREGLSTQVKLPGEAVGAQAEENRQFILLDQAAVVHWPTLH